VSIPRSLRQASVSFQRDRAAFMSPLVARMKRKGIVCGEGVVAAFAFAFGGVVDMDMDVDVDVDTDDDAGVVVLLLGDEIMLLLLILLLLALLLMLDTGGDSGGSSDLVFGMGGIVCFLGEALLLVGGVDNDGGGAEFAPDSGGVDGTGAADAAAATACNLALLLFGVPDISVDDDVDEGDRGSAVALIVNPRDFDIVAFVPSPAVTLALALVFLPSISIPIPLP